MKAMVDPEETGAKGVLEYARGDRRIPFQNLPQVSVWTGALAWAVIALAMSRVMGKLQLPVVCIAVGLCAAAIWAGHTASQYLAGEQDRRAKRSAILGLSLGWLGLASFAVLWLWNPAPHPTDRLVCASRLRGIALGIQAYADRNSGQFPPRMEALIASSTIGAEAFVCPASGDVKADGSTTVEIIANFRKPGHCSYIYLGGGLSSASALADMIVAYEKPGHHDGRGMNVMMGDGHVEWFGREEMDRILAELKAGHNPPRAKQATVPPDGAR